LRGSTGCAHYFGAQLILEALFAVAAVGDDGAWRPTGAPLDAPDCRGELLVVAAPQVGVDRVRLREST
jgi:hypothetical protein